MKKLVAYFSASSVTAHVAEKLADVTNADLFEIKPKVPYTAADLNWNNKNSRSSVEMNNQSFRPEISTKLASINEYDTIFIGFPIWWYVAPTIINTFMESYDFSNKIVIPFATSGGSGIEKAEKVLHGLVSDKTIWKSGKLIKANIDKESLSIWIDKLNLK